MYPVIAKKPMSQRRIREAHAFLGLNRFSAEFFEDEDTFQYLLADTRTYKRYAADIEKFAEQQTTERGTKRKRGLGPEDWYQNKRSNVSLGRPTLKAARSLTAKSNLSTESMEVEFYKAPPFLNIRKMESLNEIMEISSSQLSQDAEPESKRQRTASSSSSINGVKNPDGAQY